MIRLQALSRYRYFVVVCAVVIFAQTFTPLTASADDPLESITLSPTSKNYQANPGQTFSDTLTVLNDGQTAYDFSLYATPYWVNNSAYQPNFTVNQSTHADAYAWVSFSQVNWHILPRQTLTIPYTFHVPADAFPGGHYAAIFAEIQPPGGDSGLVRKKRVGCIIYATVSGAVHLSGTTTRVYVPWFQTDEPLTGIVGVKNTGNSDFTANTTYTISDIFGNVKNITKNGYEVLPGTVRDINLSWPGASWLGLYQVKVASSVLGVTTSSSAYVLIMPLWLVFLLGLAILAGGIYAVQRRKDRSKKEE